MIYYIIKSEHSWKRKDGSPYTHMSYFERIGFLGFHVFTNEEGAKQFDCKSEAVRFIKRNFNPGPNRKYTAIKISKLNP